MTTSTIEWYSADDRASIASVCNLMGVIEARAVGLLFEHTDFPLRDHKTVWRQFRDWYGGRK